MVVVRAVPQRNAEAPPSAIAQDEGPWKVADQVEVEWQGRWWPAVILEARPSRWRVHYEGYESDWDEVVGSDRIRERRVGVDEVTDESEELDPDP